MAGNGQSDEGRWLIRCSIDGHFNIRRSFSRDRLASGDRDRLKPGHQRFNRREDESAGAELPVRLLHRN